MSDQRVEEREPQGPPADGKHVKIRRTEDHAAIARLAEEMLPALIAKLTASGLGEIEVREGGWKMRLRKPEGAMEPRRSAGWASQGDHTGHLHASGHRPAEGRRPCEEESEQPAATHGTATSPAVGIFQPRKDLTVGMRIKAGEKIGAVDVLGVRQDVTAPIEGVVGASLVEPGEAVEYGQDLVRIELPERAGRDGERAGSPELIAVKGSQD